MSGSHFPDERQTETESALITCFLVSTAIEFFEDALLCFLAHANAVVFDADNDVFIGGIRKYLNEQVLL